MNVAYELNKLSDTYAINVKKEEASRQALNTFFKGFTRIMAPVVHTNATLIGIRGEISSEDLKNLAKCFETNFGWDYKNNQGLFELALLRVMEVLTLESGYNMFDRVLGRYEYYQDVIKDVALYKDTRYLTRNPAGVVSTFLVRRVTETRERATRFVTLSLH